jgi:hypothetical protein
VKLTTNLQLLHTLKKGTCVSQPYVVKTTSYLSFADAQISRDLVWVFTWRKTRMNFNPLNAELYPISHLLALLGAHPILHVNRIRVKVHSSFPSCKQKDAIRWRVLVALAFVIVAWRYTSIRPVTQLVEALCYKPGVRVFDSRWCHWYNPSVDVVCNTNEYQGYFLGGKCGRCLGLTTLPTSWDVCLELWEPQPAGTIRDCPGL